MRLCWCASMVLMLASLLGSKRAAEQTGMKGPVLRLDCGQQLSIMKGLPAAKQIMVCQKCNHELQLGYANDF